MNAPVDPIRAATRDQGIVSDPNVSAWVNASAGSGKTKVLTDRVLRLMLTGVAPERILCLTFTKAAAAEMANRISGTLAGWATMSLEELWDNLTRLTGRAGEGDVVRARALFARVVDAPGGLKVQTVHAFCQAALERFPVEAGAPPGFQALDDRAADQLLRAARDDALDAIVQGRATPTLEAALDRIAAGGAEDGGQQPDHEPASPQGAEDELQGIDPQTLVLALGPRRGSALEGITLEIEQHEVFSRSRCHGVT